MIYLQQEDDVITNPNTGDEDGEETVEITEPFMYFIRNGKFSVNVTTDHLNPNTNLDNNDTNG